MKIINPFDDWVFDTRKSTKKIDFVAESPKLKEFKENIEPLLDCDISSVNQFNSIVGDFGTGKSHINHYIYDRANENGEILASFVSCKDLIQNIKDDKSLFNLLLNELIMDLKKNSPNQIKSIITNIHDDVLGNIVIETAKENLKKAKEKDDKKQIEHNKKVLDKFYEGMILKKDSFLLILDKLKESKIYREKIKRIIFIIDEFEIFDKDYHIKDLDNIWALRDDIKKNPDIFLIFSCAGGSQKSWERLSEEKKPDMFGSDTMDAHFIPRYDKDDRREMIWSRMLSLVKGYTPSDREKYRNSEMARKYFFPFYNKRVKGDTLDGSYLVDLLSKPDLLPRRLISICYAFFADYHRFLRGKDEVYAYNLAKKELFRKHFFDIIDEKKFETVTRIIWEKIYDLYLTKAGRREDFEIHLKELFQIYVTRKIKGKILIGFENEEIHLRYINRFMQKVLKSDEPIDSRNYNAFTCLKEVEKELRERCLEHLEDPRTGFQFLEFRFKDFQPEGSIPYLTMMFHRELDKEAGPSGLVTEDQMKDILSIVLKRERNQSYDEDIYRIKRRELIDAQKLEFDEKNQKGFFILDRSKPITIERFFEEFKNIKRKSLRNPKEFFEILRDEKRSFFLPPLEKKDGEFFLEFKALNKRIPGKSRMEKFKVYFWDEVPIDAEEKISGDEFALIFTSADIGDFEKVGLSIKEHQKSEIFKRFVPEDNKYSFYVMIPSDDLIDIMDFMTWEDFFYYFKEIEKATKKLEFESAVEQLKKRLQHELNQLPNRINKLEQFRWDEGEVYHLRFKSVGKTAINEYKELLSQIMSRGSITVTMQNKKSLEILTSFYPWIAIEKYTCKLIKSKCMKKILGKDVNDGVFELYKITQRIEEPTDIEAIAETYLKSVEKKHNIIDKTKDKMGKISRFSTFLLINALVDTFPDIFQIKDDKISLIKEVEVESWDNESLSWFLSINDNDFLNLSADIIHDMEGISKTAFLDDLERTRKIHSEYLESKDKKSLSLRENSSILNASIEKHQFLSQIQIYIKKLIIDLNQKSYKVLNHSDSAYSKIIEIDNQVREIEDNPKVSQHHKEQMKNMLVNSGISGILKKYEGFDKSLGDINEYNDLINPKDPDFDVWVRILKEKPSTLLEINEVYDSLMDIGEKMDECLSKFEQSLSLTIESEKDFIVNFQAFLNQNKRVLDSIIQKAHSDITNLYNKYLRKIEVTEIQNPFVLLQIISESKLEIEKLNNYIETISFQMIDEIKEEYQKTMENLLQLSQNYSDDKDKTNGLFNTLINHIEHEMEQFKEKVKVAIKEQKDLGRWIIDEPWKKKEIYENKAHRLIKDTISKKHYEYLNQAMEDIENNNLIGSLIKIKEKKGEKEFKDRLKFLFEMENCGIISYG